MLEQLHQYSAWGMFALRFAVGIIFVVHAMPKLKNPVMVSQMLGMGGSFVGTVHGLLELLAGLALIANLYTQWASLLTGIIMVGAIYFKVVKWKTPFAAMDKTGWEFDLILLAASIAILL